MDPFKRGKAMKRDAGRAVENFSLIRFTDLHPVHEAPGLQGLHPARIPVRDFTRRRRTDDWLKATVTVNRAMSPKFRQNHCANPKAEMPTDGARIYEGDR